VRCRSKAVQKGPPKKFKRDQGTWKGISSTKRISTTKRIGNNAGTRNSPRTKAKSLMSQKIIRFEH
jgi:hypothetical protein